MLLDRRRPSRHRAQDLLAKYEIKVSVLDSAYYKITLPGTEVARREGTRDSKTMEDQPPLLERAMARAETALLILDGRRMVVGPGGATLGRSRQCDVVLNDPNVSRQHAEIRPRGGSWVLSELGSTNGSCLNGRRIEGPEVIKPGDEIELGTSVITFALE